MRIRLHKPPKIKPAKIKPGKKRVLNLGKSYKKTNNQQGYEIANDLLFWSSATGLTKYQPAFSPLLLVKREAK
jgi:hypothetical protein